MAEREQGKTLTEQIADVLIEMIQEAGYGPGDKLPTEKELCAKLGVGRNTVREALRILVSRNVVTIRQGSGTFISEKPGIADDPLGFSMVNDRKKLTKDLLQVRVIIEPSIAALAAQHATEVGIAELEEILLEMEEIMKAREDYSVLDVRFHTKIAECTGNDVMGNLIPVIGNGIAVFAKEVGQTEYEETIGHHRKIFEAIKEHRSFDAEMEMRYHLLYNSNRYK